VRELARGLAGTMKLYNALRGILAALVLFLLWTTPAQAANATRGVHYGNVCRTTVESTGAGTQRSTSAATSLGGWVSRRTSHNRNTLPDDSGGLLRDSSIFPCGLKPAN
jgi:hypothetical protein